MDERLQVQLQKVQDVICLLHRRNKNQHRQAKWWKWLSMLKRCTGKLTRELENSDTARCSARLIYMEDILFPRCYVSVVLDLEHWTVPR